MDKMVQYVVKFTVNNLLDQYWDGVDARKLHHNFRCN